MDKNIADKNPVDMKVDGYLAAIFTMMLPGLGQMLERRVMTGIFWAFIVGFGYLIYGWFGLAVHVLCILDAAFYGKLKGGEGAKGSLVKNGLLLLGLLALIVYTVLRTALF